MSLQLISGTNIEAGGLTGTALFQCTIHNSQFTIETVPALSRGDKK